MMLPTSTRVKNYPNASPTQVERIAARADRMSHTHYIYADYNDMAHCMCILSVDLDEWLDMCGAYQSEGQKAWNEARA